VSYKIRPHNQEWANNQDKLLICYGKRKKKCFAEASDEEIKKLVDNSLPRIKKKSTK